MKCETGGWLAICACAAFVAWAQPAGATIYDFDSLSLGNLPPQDNWTGSTVMGVYAAPRRGAPHPCAGNVVSTGGGLGPVAASRDNDGNWSFSLRDVTGDPYTKFVIGAPWVTDYTADGTSLGSKAMFRIVNTTTVKGIGFGIKVQPYYYQAFVTSAPQIETPGTGSLGSAQGTRLDFRMEVDTTANSGQGGATLYARNRATDLDWVAVSGLSNVNLWLTDAGAQINDANQLYIRNECTIAAMDSLMVAVPSGTLTVKAFLDKDLDGTFDPGDEALSVGWSYNVAGPCDCGYYGASPWSGTTDGSGQAVIIGGTATTPGLDDGTYSTSVTRQQYYYAAPGNPTSVAITKPVDAGDPLTNYEAAFGFRPHLGDANIDGKVNLADFTVLKANFGSAGGWSSGNFNEDTVVNLADFTILKAEFGNSHPDALGGAAVPEPATMALMAFSALGLLIRRARR